MQIPKRFLRPLLGTIIVRTWVVARGIDVNNGVEDTSDLSTASDAGVVAIVSTTSSTGLSTSSYMTTTDSTTSTSTSTTSTGITTHTIQVGPKASPHAYVPHNITANAGDIVVFEFYPTNHSVAKADYLAPCVPASSGEFWSGEFNSFTEDNGELVGPAPTWSITVNDTEPTFFYCTALGSCLKNGMVGSINANSSQTWEAQYKRALTYPYMLLPGESMPAETSSSDSSSSSSSSGSRAHSLSTGAIAGIVVACVAFVGILIALFWTLGRNRIYQKWMSSEDGRTERTARWAFSHSHAKDAPPKQKSKLDNNTVGSMAARSEHSHFSSPQPSSYNYASQDLSHRVPSEVTNTTRSMYGALALQRGSGQWNWDAAQHPRNQRGPTELDATSASPP
ncbi:hypothetical protein N7520_002839, partial [Penicillium odoratum]|uniref:uncharacterized protein n=1 Tax=Penicillium odoratum TaxID=1167516 RepID=UPI002546904F